MSDSTKAHLTQIMLRDALDAVKVIYGDVGLAAVIRHMSSAHKARERNAEIDEIEEFLAQTSAEQG